MDIEQLYDEFGNYIGPDDDDDDNSIDDLPDDPLDVAAASPSDLPAPVPPNQNGHPADDAPDTTAQGVVVLAEDKQLYPTADEVFGPDTEVLIEEEDSQPITEPLVAPPDPPPVTLHESDKSIPSARYSRAFLTEGVLPFASRNRTLAFLGHIHHGKTSLADLLFAATHDMPAWSALDERDYPPRYLDTRTDEQRLHISLKTSAATLLLEPPRAASLAVTVLDAPGHASFADEAEAALTLCDGAVILVDAAEGVLSGTRIALQRAAAHGVDIVLVLSKLDRLVLELRLPPSDAYHKLRHVIESCNEILASFNVPLLDPARGNVAFAAATERVCFTLPQFARTYISTAAGGEARFPLTADQFARRLWGDVYYDAENRKFRASRGGMELPRSFVALVLEPFYKLHSAVVSHDVDDLVALLGRNDMLSGKPRRGCEEKAGFVDRGTLKADLKAVLRSVAGSSFGMGDVSGFAEMTARHIRAPPEGATRKLSMLMPVGRDLNTGGLPNLIDKTGEETGNGQEENGGGGESATELMRRSWLTAMKECDGDEQLPASAYIAKLLPDEHGKRLDCLLRVMSGRLRVGDSVSILGHGYDTANNSDEHASARIEGLFVPCGRFTIPVREATAGQVVLARGLERTVDKSGTVVSQELTKKLAAFAFRPLTDFLTPAVMKVAIEPVRPADLPKMVAALRNCMQNYPGLEAKVEETGEHTIIGAGELYLDCVLRDLRAGGTDSRVGAHVASSAAARAVDIKVSDPVVPFCETVSECSAIQCYADSPNGQNKLVMIAEPLESDVLAGLQDGAFERGAGHPIATQTQLRERGLDALAARSLWAFGPDEWRGPNALFNDALDPTTRRRADESLRDSVVAGFDWAVREGPLADEPVRGAKLRLLDAVVAPESGGSGAQVIATARRVVFSSLLTAAPRLMEPLYEVEVVCARAAAPVVQTVATRRRGLVVDEADVAGTGLRRLALHVPVLDAVGLEADIRSLSHGAAFCQMRFARWAVMPGDPLDRDVSVKTLEPARRHELARECMVKTRRRKGLDEQVSVTKYFDDPLLAELVRDNAELRNVL